MGEQHVFRGSGNSGDKRTSDNLKANRTVNRQALETSWDEDKKNVKIGRASCRERVSPYV